MSRNFNRKQKEALYQLVGGKCQVCGEPLPKNWHADHIHPYVLGGETDVVNGQALCPKCNLRKGKKTMSIDWPSQYTLRVWQQAFLDQYEVQQKEDFLLVATPGAGKTVAALKVANSLLNSGTVKQIVIVCPTDHLRNQWIQEATNVNIHLDKLQTDWNSRILVTQDYVGLVTTYAQVVAKAEHLRAYTSRANTCVIFDEIHHCGDEENLAWGQAIKHAFDSGGASRYRRLLLSGTPFRSDNNPIPFVDYESDEYDPTIRRAQSDFSYGYGDALKDEKVVRHIVFPTWDGTLEWRNNFGDPKQATLQDDLNFQESSERLRTAIHYQGQWIRDVIRAANEKLNNIRQVEGQTNAGGLIIAKDQIGAKELAGLLEEITGEAPTLAISEIGDEASSEISKFTKGTRKWIVAVRMVSEGVDIKRLRIGVYATNILTRTFFRQAIGRVIRWDAKWEHLDDQTAWFYVPEDPELVKYMKEIRKEIVDVIRIQEENDKKGKSQEPSQLPLGAYEFVGAYDAVERLHHFNGEGFTIDELQVAEKHFTQFPGFERVSLAAKAYAVRHGLFGQAATETAPSSRGKVIVPKTKQKQNLKSLASNKVSRLVRVCQQNGIEIRGPNPYMVVNAAWARHNGHSQQLTNQQLEQKITWLETLITRALAGDRSLTKDLTN